MEDKINILTDSELVKMAQEGSETATEILIKKYDGLVSYIASSYVFNLKDNVIDKEVILQEGRVGILNAIKTFDESKNIKFKTYVSTCISNRVINAIKKETNSKIDFLSLDGILEGEKEVQIASNLNTEEDVLFNELFNSILSKESKVFSSFERTVLIELLRGLSYKEIAENLEKTPKQIDNTIQRIKKKVTLYITR